MLQYRSINQDVKMFRNRSIPFGSFGKLSQSHGSETVVEFQIPPSDQPGDGSTEPFIVPEREASANKTPPGAGIVNRDYAAKRAVVARVEREDVSIVELGAKTGRGLRRNWREGGGGESKLQEDVQGTGTSIEELPIRFIPPENGSANYFWLSFSSAGYNRPRASSRR